MMQVHVRHEDAYNEYAMVLFHRHPIPIIYYFANFIVPYPYLSCSVQTFFFSLSIQSTIANQTLRNFLPSSFLSPFQKEFRSIPLHTIYHTYKRALSWLN